MVIRTLSKPTPLLRSSIATKHATNSASPTQSHAVTSSFVRPFVRSDDACA